MNTSAVTFRRARRAIMCGGLVTGATLLAFFVVPTALMDTYWLDILGVHCLALLGVAWFVSRVAQMRTLDWLACISLGIVVFWAPVLYFVWWKKVLVAEGVSIVSELASLPGTRTSPAQPPCIEAPTDSGSGEADSTSELESLFRLYRSGVISEAEFAELKKGIAP